MKRMERVRCDYCHKGQRFSNGVYAQLADGKIDVTRFMFVCRKCRVVFYYPLTPMEQQVLWSEFRPIQAHLEGVEPEREIGQRVNEQNKKWMEARKRRGTLNKVIVEEPLSPT